MLQWSIQLRQIYFYTPLRKLSKLCIKASYIYIGTVSFSFRNILMFMPVIKHLCKLTGLSVKAHCQRNFMHKEGDPNDPLSWPCYTLQGLAFSSCAVPKPHSVAIGLHGFFVEGGEVGLWQASMLPSTQEVKALLCLLSSRVSVNYPGEVIRDVHTKKGVSDFLINQKCSADVFLKSTSLSFVFSTFIDRLFSLHLLISCLTSSL